MTTKPTTATTIKVKPETVARLAALREKHGFRSLDALLEYLATVGLKEPRLMRAHLGAEL